MYYRSRKEQEKLKKLYENKRTHYYEVYYDEEKKIYRRYYKGKGYTYLKKVANRHNRRLVKKGVPYNKNYYDLWWNWD